MTQTMNRQRGRRSSEESSPSDGWTPSEGYGAHPVSGITPPPNSDAGSSITGHAFVRRYTLGIGALLLVFGLIIGRLFYTQIIDGAATRKLSESQRTVTEVQTALRGDITDRSGKKLAFTIQSRNLTFQPTIVRAQLKAIHQKDPSKPDVQTRLDQIATDIVSKLAEGGMSVDKDDLLAKLNSNNTFTYLVKNVDANIASKITHDFPEVGAERNNIRVYPGGALGANIIGDTGSDGHGLIGLESSLDAQLSGKNGSLTYDRGEDGAVIPGSTRNVHPAVNGDKVELTLDADLQYFVQEQVALAKQKSGAKHAEAVVLDAKTGQVLAMANDNTFDPSKPLDQQQNAETGNTATSSPFEPGSVNKIVTASAAIQYGITNPYQVHEVPGSINMSGVTVHDWWSHSRMPITTAGIFAKSSNVGTLMLAQQVGQQRYADMLKKFGLGQLTNVGIPGESAGDVPPLSQWSGGTFANLPIGQGLSMTLLQMTGMYQTIANNGERIPPRIIKSIIKPDGAVVRQPAPKPVQVVSPKTALTVRDMFRAVVQNDPGNQAGTGKDAAIEGYQISGKTGTAQQVDPSCGCYSNSKYNITFAGMAPVQNPRFVIGIMLDAPSRSSDGSRGESAGPLFKTIASWLLRHDDIPVSASPAPKYVLEPGR